MNKIIHIRPSVFSYLYIFILSDLFPVFPIYIYIYIMTRICLVYQLFSFKKAFIILKLKQSMYLSSSWVAFGRPSYLWAVLPGVPRHWRFPPASGGHPPRLLPWGAPKRGMPTGPKVFWPCRTRVGFGPATGPTLKAALCHIRALVGRIDKYQSM